MSSPTATGEPPTRGSTVLFVSYPAGLGGSARSLLTLLGELDGVCHRVVARRPGTTVARHLETHHLADGVVDLAPRTRGRGGRATDALRLAHWARAHRNDLAAIHANGLSETQVAALAARAAGVRLVVWVHEPQIPALTRRMAPLVRALVPAVDWVTVSEASRIAFLTTGVSGDAPVHVVPNPVSVDDLGARDGLVPAPPAATSADAPVTITYVGAPAAYKGFRLLPDVIDATTQPPATTRWSIWSGPQTAEPDVWRRLHATTSAVVDLHDKTPMVAEAYAGADIVFCPSLEESFGRVAAEAMAFGRPVVASDLPALREVLGAAGTFFPPGDARAAAEALTELAAAPERRAELAARGRARAAAYAPERITAALRARYRLPAGGADPNTTRPMVVSHEATRTGAPVVAVQVAEALAEGGNGVEVVLRAHGPLDEDFRRSATALHREAAPRVRVALRWAAQRTRGRRLDQVANRLDERLASRILDRVPTDLVWCNTVLSANYIRPALARDLPVVLHVHELGRLVPGVLRRYGLVGADGQPRLPPSVVLVAASTESRAELAEALRVASDDIELLESTIDVAAVARTGAAGVRRGRDTGDRDTGDQDTGDQDPADRPVVIGACGHATERKGPDLWLEIAGRVHRERPNTRFVWVGRDGERFAATPAARDLGAAVRFTGESATAVAEMAEFDLFTLPSRHDTFPLVVLEAMALGLPVVAFDAGGARRQVADTGAIVPAGDLDAFAAAIVDLIDDPDRRARMGAAAHRRVTELFDVSRFRPEVRRIAARARAGGGPIGREA